jgi:hypothetical protein
MAVKGTAEMEVMTETAAAVYQREHWSVSSVSEIRIM